MQSLRRAGYEPTEEDFMEAYGPMEAEKAGVFAKRHFRYTFGAARINSLRFEAYIFPSEIDAEDFGKTVGDESGWYRYENMIFRTAPENMKRLAEVLEKTLEGNDQRARNPD